MNTSCKRRALVKAGAALAGSAAFGLPDARRRPGRGQLADPSGAHRRAVRAGRHRGHHRRASSASSCRSSLASRSSIENKGGASTTIGAADVFKSPADGYTLMVVTPTFAVAQSVYPNLPFGPKDFTPVALFITTPLLLVVNPSTRLQDGRRLHQVCQGEPRQDHVRVVGRGQHAAPGLRAPDGAGGHRAAAHPVQGRRRGGRVGAVRHDRQLFLGADRVGPARASGQARGARRLRPEARAVVPRCADHRRERVADLRDAALHVDARARGNAAGHPEQAFAEHRQGDAGAGSAREVHAERRHRARARSPRPASSTRRSTRRGRRVVQKAGIKPT